MTAPPLTRPERMRAWLASPKVTTYLLGLLGWAMVLYAMPFDWSLPAYAEF